MDISQGRAQPTRDTRTRPAVTVTVPLSSDVTGVYQATVTMPVDLTEAEWVQFYAVLEAMKPALVLPVKEG